MFGEHFLHFVLKFPLIYVIKWSFYIMKCIKLTDLAWLSDRNLSLGVEGGNGMASVGGPNSPAMNVFDYYCASPLPPQ